MESRQLLSSCGDREKRCVVCLILPASQSVTLPSTIFHTEPLHSKGQQHVLKEKVILVPPWQGDRKASVLVKGLLRAFPMRLDTVELQKGPQRCVPFKFLLP